MGLSVTDTNPVGRPTLYNLQLADILCTRISEGENLTEICKTDGMPCRMSVYRWMREHPEFGDAYTRAREERADTLADEIISVADDSALDHNDRRVKIDARKWAASKLNRRLYGDRITVDGDMRVKMTDDQIESRIAQLIGKTRATIFAGRDGEADEQA